MTSKIVILVLTPLILLGCATAARDNEQERVDAILTAAIARNGFPAAAVARITSGTIRFASAGVRRVGSPDRVTTNDKFGLGSNTKAFTASMIGALVERGVLRWDMPLGEALRDVPMLPEYRHVTLRHLLTHRAGIRPWTSDEAFTRAASFNRPNELEGRLAFAAAVLAEAPVNVPGAATQYSNAGFSIASLIAEQATHQTWRQLITSYVCVPGRFACTFGPPAAHDPNQPWGHSRATGKLVPVDPTVGFNSAMLGAGGLSLSIADYARFLQMHLRGLRGQDTPILRSETIRELHRPEGRYALGWGVQEYAGAPSSIHAGGNGQFYALVAIQPGRDRAVAFLTNDGGDDVEDQASAVLKELLAD